MSRAGPRPYIWICSFSPVLWLAAGLSLTQSGCGLGERTEAWEGYFQFTGDSTRHPIYLALTIDAREVRGRAYQPDGTTASITGMLEGRAYSLRLQRTHETTGEADVIHYEGDRAVDRLYGEWSLGGDVQGALYLQLTDLSPEQSLQPG